MESVHKWVAPRFIIVQYVVQSILTTHQIAPTALPCILTRSFEISRNSKKASKNPPICTSSIPPPPTTHAPFAGILLLALTLASYNASLNANKNAAVTTLCVTFAPTPLYNPLHPSSPTTRRKLPTIPPFSPPCSLVATCMRDFTVM